MCAYYVSLICWPLSLSLSGPFCSTRSSRTCLSTSTSRQGMTSSVCARRRLLYPLSLCPRRRSRRFTQERGPSTHSGWPEVSRYMSTLCPPPPPSIPPSLHPSLHPQPPPLPFSLPPLSLGRWYASWVNIFKNNQEPPPPPAPATSKSRKTRHKASCSECTREYCMDRT